MRAGLDSFFGVAGLAGIGMHLLLSLDMLPIGSYDCKLNVTDQ
ncbi:hypothetical protein PATSB16_32650 [Pandoraea thiooxydans]|nr:hypothetical protein PATSB16_32650 [Pandoraea thiooxydans]